MKRKRKKIVDGSFSLRLDSKFPLSIQKRLNPFSSNEDLSIKNKSSSLFRKIKLFKIKKVKMRKFISALSFVRSKKEIVPDSFFFLHLQSFSLP